MKKRINGVFTGVGVSVVAATSAMAAPTAADLWTAADVSTLASSSITLLVAAVGVTLVFITARLVKKALNKVG